MTDSVKIIENGLVVTCDRQNRTGMLSLLVKGDRIAEISTRTELLKSIYPSAEIIDAEGKVLLPGFVDAHYHGESFILRNFTGLTPAARWSRDSSIKKPLEYIYRQATSAELLGMYRQAYFAALKSGVTTIAEFGFDNLDLPFSASAEAMQRADVRGTIGIHNGDQIEKARALSDPGLRYALVFPSEEDLTTYNIQSSLRAANDFKLPLIVHYGETRKGAEIVKKNFQRSIVRLLQDYKLYERELELLHFSCLEDGDLETLAATGLPVVLTPRSVLLKETEHPPIGTYLASGIPVALGSDWGVSDPFLNMQAFVILARILEVQLPSPHQVLAMHTINGARAVGIGSQTGSLEAGKKADITFVDISEARLANLKEFHDENLFLTTLLLEASSRDVSDVMVDGEFFVRQHQIMTYSEEDFLTDGRNLIQRLSALLPPKEKTAELPPVLPMQFGEREESGAGSFEEGFRIVSKQSPPTEEQPKVIPIRVEPPRADEEPKKIDRVFGEDDF